MTTPVKTTAVKASSHGMCSSNSVKAANPFMGLMLESNLNPGRSDLAAGKALAHGVSITDACLGWKETEALLGELANMIVTKPV